MKSHSQEGTSVLSEPKILLCGMERLVNNVLPPRKAPAGSGCSVPQVPLPIPGARLAARKHTGPGFPLFARAGMG